MKHAVDATVVDPTIHLPARCALLREKDSVILGELGEPRRSRRRCPRPLTRHGRRPTALTRTSNGAPVRGPGPNLRSPLRYLPDAGRTVRAHDRTAEHTDSRREGTDMNTGRHEMRQGRRWTLAAAGAALLGGLTAVTAAVPAQGHGWDARTILRNASGTRVGTVKFDGDARGTVVNVVVHGVTVGLDEFHRLAHSCQRRQGSVRPNGSGVHQRRWALEPHRGHAQPPPRRPPTPAHPDRRDGHRTLRHRALRAR
jgi:hypothetical protein